MADYSSFIVIWLALFWSTDGPFADSKGNNRRRNIKTRFRRNNDWQRDYNKNGYAVLNKSEMDVKFLINNHKHFARLKWNSPTVKKNVPVTAFLVCWKGQLRKNKCKCVSNKTLEFDIWPSESNWKYNNILNVCVFPMPSMNPTCEMTSFTPDYKGRTTNHTSSTASTMYTTAAGTRNDTTSTRNVTVNGTNNAASTRNDEYSSKLIVGSVIGVGMAVVLIIILVKTFGGNNDPPPNKPDTYYISHYPEGDNFVKELKKFVKWLDENGFNVQMLTDEEDLLSAENKCLRRELMSFRFREHMIRTSDKVFVILSPLYIRLCEMREDDVLNENLTEEEKMVKREIAQIRCELNETIFRTDRFIPIRFRLGEMASIPFWIKDFELFSWPEEKTTTRLLNKLNGLPEYHLSVSQN